MRAITHGWGGGWQRKTVLLTSRSAYMFKNYGVFLLTLQPFITFCRPHPMHKNRPYFNWTHFIIGTIAHVLSIPTIMLGLRMPAAGVQLRSLNYPLWILIFFVIFQFCVELTLEIHGCIHYRRNKRKFTSLVDFERVRVFFIRCLGSLLF